MRKQTNLFGRLPIIWRTLHYPSRLLAICQISSGDITGQSTLQTRSSRRICSWLWWVSEFIILSACIDGRQCRNHRSNCLRWFYSVSLWSEASLLYSISPFLACGIMLTYQAYLPDTTLLSFMYDPSKQEASFCYGQNKDAPLDDEGHRYPCMAQFPKGLGTAGYGKSPPVPNPFYKGQISQTSAGKSIIGAGVTAAKLNSGQHSVEKTKSVKSIKAFKPVKFSKPSKPHAKAFIKSSHKQVKHRHSHENHGMHKRAEGDSSESLTLEKPTRYLQMDWCLDFG